MFSLLENKNCTFLLLIPNDYIFNKSIFILIYPFSMNSHHTCIVHKPLRQSSDIVDRSQVFTVLNILKILCVVQVKRTINKKVVNTSKLAG